MRIAVFGAGGTGGYLGALLSRSANQVSMIARGENLKAIQAIGLRVESTKGDFVVRPAQVTSVPAEIGTVDTVIVAVKAWQVPEAAQAIVPLVGPDTAVVALQNGVDAPTQLADVLGEKHVMIGLLILRSFRISPGCFRHTFDSDPNLQIGEFDNRPSQRAEDLASVFRAAGLSVAIPPDIRASLWEKFCWACYSAGIPTVCRSPMGIWRQQPELRRMAEEAGLEAAAIAKANGVIVPEGFIDRFRHMTDNLAPTAKPSMQDDIMNGRPSELESWNGAAVRLGLECGVDTPVNSFIYHCLLPLEMKARGQVEFD